VAGPAKKGKPRRNSEFGTIVMLRESVASHFSLTGYEPGSANPL
jgi:hypothetical protein